MALKAYKHLTDGEVKLVEESSAEEASLLGDVVHGASYLELTSTGHSQEVAAAQGSALWEDVSDELGGSAFSLLAEVDPTDSDQAHVVSSAPLLVGSADDAESWWGGDGTTQLPLVAVINNSIYFAPGGGFSGFPTIIQPGHIDLVQKGDWANNAHVSITNADTNAASTLAPGALSLQDVGGSRSIIIDTDGDVAIQGVGKISTHA